MKGACKLLGSVSMVMLQIGAVAVGLSHLAGLQALEALAHWLDAGPDAPPAGRDERQAIVARWCAEAFGVEHATTLSQRGIRLLEEALELGQAAGCDRAMVHQLVDFVFDRPVGKLGAELGGVGVTLLALAQAAGYSAEAEEAREVARVLAKPLEEFRKRNQAKNAAGFNTTPTGAQS